MEEIIFDKVYDTSCADMEDIFFLGSFSHENAVFSECSREEKCRFSRLASGSAILAEALGGRLTVFQSDNGIVLFIEAKQIKLNSDVLQMLNNILATATLDIYSQEDRVCFKIIYVLT